MIAGGGAALTLAMIAVGVEADLLRLQLVAKDMAGVVSYGNASAVGPPLAPVVTIVVLIAAGVIDGGTTAGHGSSPARSLNLLQRQSAMRSRLPAI